MGSFAGYRLRFLAVYIGLALVFAASTVAGVGARVDGWFQPRPPWSTWQPAPSGVGATIDRIARHVEREYRVSETGAAHLTHVYATIPPHLANDLGPRLVPVLFRRSGPNAPIQVLSADGTPTYTLCGRGAGCSLPAGERLLARRQALELALLTLHFVPSARSVVVFPPPLRDHGPSYAMLFDRSDVANFVAAPLNTTLSLARPPLAGAPDPAEAQRIDSLTLRHVYRFSPVELPLGGVALNLVRTR